jgi:UDP:flavonoid glycosyltransferase YjiC (YdhE family)
LDVRCCAGAGTSAKALLAGVPTVVYPHAFDTQDTADHLARAGASLTLPFRTLSPENLAAALRRLLAEPSFAAAAAVLRDAAAAEGACAARKGCTSLSLV